MDEIGNVTLYDQKQNIILSSAKTTLEVHLTFYSFEKTKVWESIDKNKDRTLSSEEQAFWIRLGSTSSWIEQDGRRIDFVPEQLTFPEYYDFFAAPPSTVVLTFTAPRLPMGKHAVYYYRGKDKKLDQLDFSVKGIEGISAYDMVKKDADAVLFRVDAGTVTEQTLAGMPTNTRLDMFLRRYVKTSETSVLLWLLALGTAATIGALHAFTPGHGKALVAGFLIGERGTVLHALNLGLIITVTHTMSVFILGLAALFLTQYIVPARIISGLHIVSALMVITFGIFLFIRRVLVVLRPDSRFRGQDSHTHRYAPQSLRWTNLLPMGISAGMLPCVDALAILVVSASLGKIIYGLLLLVAFSLGLAIALISLGVATVLAHQHLGRFSRHSERTAQLLSILSAGVIILLGVAMLWYLPV